MVVSLADLLVAKLEFSMVEKWDVLKAEKSAEKKVDNLVENSVAKLVK
jgi:hypothetical protein